MNETAWQVHYMYLLSESKTTTKNLRTNIQDMETLYPDFYDNWKKEHFKRTKKIVDSKLK